MSGRRLMPQPDAEVRAAPGLPPGPLPISSCSPGPCGAKRRESPCAGSRRVAAVVMNRAAALTEGAIDDACRSFACWSPDNPDLARMPV